MPPGFLLLKLSTRQIFGWIRPAFTESKLFIHFCFTSGYVKQVSTGKDRLISLK